MSINQFKGNELSGMRPSKIVQQQQKKRFENRLSNENRQLTPQQNSLSSKKGIDTQSSGKPVASNKGIDNCDGEFQNAVGGDGSSDDLKDIPTDLLCQLSTKRRLVHELEFQLREAKKELQELEKQTARYGNASRSNGGVPLGQSLGGSLPGQEFTNLLQRKIKDVHNSAALAKGKQSISSFFQDVQPAPVLAKSGTVKSKPSLLQLTQSKLQSLKVSSNGDENNNRGVTNFFGMLKDKFQEFNVNEDEEHEFDGDRDLDRFCLKEKMEYDSEEEVSSEEVDHNFSGFKYEKQDAPLIEDHIVASSLGAGKGDDVVAAYSRTKY
ncbi:Acf4p Ecym_4663 [Eremothecium cymbalariae DBVPG|uniref:Uncharacterized protein n=1 Tax=Eremothecium cymbalariae (strain CBS 270.75 / DBVPG 7215 / KCTC 17166 / NRRL Y-17582) TaxID=931890 RepID=G8JSG2_ERECY|nr:hypothetical protein Ecym_4663 [Eremothecium cymbalariae DBVPG\